MFKKDNPKFYVTMGSYNGTEFCQLVGLYLLNFLTKVLSKPNIGLYRNDSLNCFENILGSDSEKVKKKIFKKNGLIIIVACNLIVTDFLGANLWSRIWHFLSVSKTKVDLSYINRHSNKYH